MTLRRRDLITLLGGAAAAWPLAARAHQTATPVIGWLSSRSTEMDRSLLPAFRQGLSVHGFGEGRNVAIEYRFANGNYDQLGALSGDLIQRRAAVIVNAGAGASTTSFLLELSSKIPVVFITATDPVKAGIVPNLARPGGNLTGVTTLFRELAPKRRGLLHELLPHAGTIAVLVNSLNRATEEEITALQEPAHVLGKDLKMLYVPGTDDGVDQAFARLTQMRPDAILVATDPFFFTRANQIAILMARLGLPALYFRREFVAAGGLMSYGSSPDEFHRRAGEYTGRILKGEKAGDLPVQQPTKFELSINVRTAKALNLTVPNTLLAIADDVIE
jgi:putative ABC transport system substrate-binding protein